MSTRNRFGDLKALNAVACKPSRRDDVFRSENFADSRDFRSACSNPFAQQGPFYAMVQYKSRIAWWRVDRFSEAESVFELQSQNHSMITVSVSEILDTGYVDNGFLVGAMSFLRSFTSLASRSAKMDIEDAAPFFITPVNFNYSADDHVFMQLLGYGDPTKLDRYSNAVLPDSITIAQRPPLTRKLVGETPQNYAISIASRTSVSWLLGRGHNPNVTNQRGVSAAFAAAAIGDASIIDLLAKHGACLEIADDRGLTPLHIAICNNNTEAALLLLERGVSAKATDESGETPLHCIGHDSFEIVDALLASGADINAQDNSGQTPLHFSVENGFTSVAKHLVRCGADIGIQDNAGVSPLDNMDVQMKKEIGV